MFLGSFSFYRIHILLCFGILDHNIIFHPHDCPIIHSWLVLKETNTYHFVHGMHS